MDAPGAAAPVLLALVGYSCGSVLAAGSRRIVPGPGDLAAVAALWASLLLGSAGQGRWPAAAAGLVAGAALGIAGTVLRRGEAGRPDADGGAEDKEGTGAWAAWKRFAARMGSFQGRMLMGFFYFVVLPPFALLARLRGEGRPDGAAATFWLPRPAASAELRRARDQF
ncbi:MAG: hypothetical protein ABW277_02575 [Longimicrobiaceae bacterium]